MSKARIETYGSTVDLLGIDTDGALKKVARSVVSTGVASALSIEANTYTPTFAISGNITSLGTTYVHYYTRVNVTKDVVTVAGSKDITVTAAGVATFTVSLPVASDLTAADEAMGIVGSISANFVGGTVYADTANNLAIVQVRVGAGGAIGLAYSFSFEVK